MTKKVSKKGNDEGKKSKEGEIDDEGRKKSKEGEIAIKAINDEGAIYLYQYESSEHYTDFIDEIRLDLAETKEGDVFVLPHTEGTRKYSHVNILFSETAKIRVKILRINAYAVAFAIDEGDWHWFRNHAPVGEQNLLSLTSSDYGSMMTDANFGDLGDVRVGQSDLDGAYHAMKKYLKTDQKLQEKIPAARAIITIIILICEAARFNDIKSKIVDKYDLGYSLYEEEHDEKRLEKRVKGWSATCKRLDKDVHIRMTQYTDWMIYKEKVERTICAVDKIEIKEELSDSANPKPPEGYNERKIPGDGHCQFRGLSLQIYLTEDDHDKVRREVLEQLERYPDFYKYFNAPDVDGHQVYDFDGEFKTYLAKITGGDWGDALTLQAAADLYNLEVLTFTLGAQSVWTEYKTTRNEAQRGRDMELPASPDTPTPNNSVVRKVYLSYYKDDKHYNSLSPK
ncbi:hypothetical protein CASFOL_039065 [Castilleja foliolosa]|uniref:OTU domain-containing protein n=1 Tax=Castilleja foliolosa TaxID=1961234 RepID=A0ABD3BGY6_9LAMI